MAAFFFNSLRSLWVIYENAQIDLINLRKRTLQITRLFGHAHITHNALKYINVTLCKYRWCCCCCPLGLMNVNKQTVVTVGQLKVISIKKLEKSFKAWNLPQWKQTTVGELISKRSVALLRANQIDLRELIGGKEHVTFWSYCSERWNRMANFCSYQSARSDIWKSTQPTSVSQSQTSPMLSLHHSTINNIMYTLYNLDN